MIVFPDTDLNDNSNKKSVEINNNGYRNSVLDTFQNYETRSGFNLVDIKVRLVHSKVNNKCLFKN